jgi:hypothetical protein
MGLIGRESRPVKKGMSVDVCVSLLALLKLKAI